MIMIIKILIVAIVEIINPQYNGYSVAPFAAILFKSSEIKATVMQQEIWKKINGFEDCYLVSNKGRIKSLDRIDASGMFRKSRMIKLNNASGGYKNVCLAINGTKTTKLVHRIVAESFIPNHKNFPQVNHKNGIKSDNTVENLEWCSVKYNNQHAYDIGLKKSWMKNRFGKLSPTSKPLIQMDLTGKFIARFDGTKDAERKTGFKSNRIADACNGVIKTSKGYRWKYINDSLDKQNIQP